MLVSVLFVAVLLPNVVAGQGYADYLEQDNVIELNLNQVNEILEEETIHQEHTNELQFSVTRSWITEHHDLPDRYIQRCQTPPPDYI